PATGRKAERRPVAQGNGVRAWSAGRPGGTRGSAHSAGPLRTRPVIRSVALVALIALVAGVIEPVHPFGTAAAASGAASDPAAAAASSAPSAAASSAQLPGAELPAAPPPNAALVEAVLAGDDGRIRELAAAGADPNSVDSRGTPLLQRAMR